LSNVERAIVMIPTYNERENIAPLVEMLLDIDPSVDVLIVDDDSPDGTGEIADGLAARSARVRVMHRCEDRGRGTAGRDGFLECLRLGHGYILEMDADFSHDPADVPRLIRAARSADVAVGSRLVPGGGEEGRSLVRILITYLASAYLRLALGVPGVRDCTSGFRCFRRRAMAGIHVETLRSRGPSIVTEILFRCRRMRIVEIPIFFRNRRAGRSKFNIRAMYDSLILPWIMRLRGEC